MLAENLVSSPGHCKLDSSSPQERMRIEYKEGDYDRGSAEPNIGKKISYYVLCWVTSYDDLVQYLT